MIRSEPSDILTWAPMTAQHLADGMTVSASWDAAITVSDNTAANLLVELLGDPPAVTAFARTLNDIVTRVDRLEPDLNSIHPATRETPPHQRRWRPTCTPSCSQARCPPTAVTR